MKPETVAPKRNIELKARLASIDDAREIAKSVATDYLGCRTQIDTYFCCSQGRLKLRQTHWNEPDGDGADRAETDTPEAQLVSYQRADVADAKASDYRLLDVAEPEKLLDMLSESLGILCVVAKQRQVFMYENVRIHLDEVETLGTFLEFEAVLDDKTGDVQGHSQIAYLSKVFKISTSHLLQGSYSDMMDRQNRQ